MAESGFYFDTHGTTIPPLRFSSDELSLLDGQLDRSEATPQHGPSASKTPARNRTPLPSLKRQSQQHTSNIRQDAIGFVNSDDEGSLGLVLRNSGSSPITCSLKDLSQTRTIPPRVSMSEGMAAAKRLSRAATRPAPPKDIPKPAFSAKSAEKPAGIKSFGPHANSFEFKDRKLLVELGIEEPVFERSGLSDPNAFEDLLGEFTEYILPEPPPTNPGLPSTSTPPSSYIPLDEY
ncbi:hypothetical protein GGR52DRAFT_555452 [Hypoxylon sp. FL1284]|nr:hypothetical protein GGR52DRAFT_555452 [Hypoxylon sp. FL1284]